MFPRTLYKRKNNSILKRKIWSSKKVLSLDFVSSQHWMLIYIYFMLHLYLSFLFPFLLPVSHSLCSLSPSLNILSYVKYQPFYVFSCHFKFAVFKKVIGRIIKANWKKFPLFLILQKPF